MSLEQYAALHAWYLQGVQLGQVPEAEFKRALRNLVIAYTANLDQPTEADTADRGEGPSAVNDVVHPAEQV